MTALLARANLTGAMQLHALSLMDPAGFPAQTREVAASSSLETGAPPALFARGVERFCSRPD